jgi:putative copper resistance protein D
MAQGPLGYLQLAVLVAIHVGVALLLGAWACGRWLRGADSRWAVQCLAQAASAGRFGLGLAAIALVAAAWVQAAVVAEVPLQQAGSALLILLRDTHYGHLGISGLVAWLTVGIASWRTMRPQGTWGALAMSGVVVMAWSRSAVSHAANAGDYSLDVAVDAVHLIATCLWVGAVFIAAQLSLPSASATTRERMDATEWVSSLSSNATVALLVVVSTGAFKVWRSVGDWAALPGSDYGTALSVKLVLVGLAVALGGFNRFKVLPGLFGSLRRPDVSGVTQRWHGRLLGVLRLEALVLFLVLAAAAVLASTEPPGA